MIDFSGFEGLDWDVGAVETTSSVGRYLTADDIKSGKYKGKMHVRIVNASQQRDCRNKPFLQVEYSSTLDCSPWRTTGRYFNLKQSEQLLRSVGVTHLKGDTVNDQLSDKLLDIELGVRTGSDGKDYPKVIGHHERITHVLQDVSNQ